MTLNREIEQVLSRAMFGKDTEELDLGEAGKFVKSTEKILNPLTKFVENKLKPKFRFKMNYYYKDKTGYYFDTGTRTPISIVAEDKVAALKLLSSILPPTDGRSDFTLRYEIRSIEQVEGNE